MADSFVLGGDDLRLRLASLPQSLARTILRSALRQGANRIAAAARANFVASAMALGAQRSDTENPQTVSGALQASIRVVERSGTPTRVTFNIAAGALSASQKRKFGAESAYYALWVEKGHINRKMNDALRGSQRFKEYQRKISESNTPAHHYMAPAADSEFPGVLEDVSAAIADQLGKL